MTAATTSHVRRHRRSTHGEELSAAGRQAAARAVWLDSHRAGRPLTGSQLGARFGRSRSWGNARIHEARHPRPAGSHTASDQAHGDSELANDHTGSHEPAGADASRAATNDGQAPAPVGPAPTTVEQAPATAELAATSPAQPASTRPAGRAGRRLDTAVVAVVALVAAAASYEHQRHLALIAGEGALAWVLPVSVDGMMLATSRSILRRRRVGIPVPAVCWLGFVLGMVASVAANVAAAEPTLVGRLLAGWPPLALFIAYETLAADHGDFRS